MSAYAVFVNKSADKEMIVYLSDTYTIDDAIKDRPEWSFVSLDDEDNYEADWND